MKIFQVTLLLIAITSFTSCASGYKNIEPKTINFVSTNETDNVKLEYKYELLDKKYAKKENKRDIKLVALKITNNSEKDIVFGKNAILTYANDREASVMNNEKVYKKLKQSPATYLWYLLLTPINFYTSETNSNGFEENTSSTPIGLVLGPGIAGGNMIVASSANKKFKSELLEYNINGTTIKKGETKYGLIGIRSDSFDSLQIKIE